MDRGGQKLHGSKSLRYYDRDCTVKVSSRSLNLEGFALKEQSAKNWSGMIKVTSLSALVVLISVAFIVSAMFGPKAKAAAIAPTTAASISAIEALELSVARLMADNSTSVPTTDRNSSGWVTARMRVTGYCPCSKCCGKDADGITANGHYIRWGDTFVAADKKYSFGTELRVPGYNKGRPVKILDRSGAIKGNRLDMFFDTHSQGKTWGVKYLDVKIKK